MSESEKKSEFDKKSHGKLNLQIEPGDVLNVGKSRIELKKAGDRQFRVHIQAPRDLKIFLDMSGRKKKSSQPEKP